MKKLTKIIMMLLLSLILASFSAKDSEKAILVDTASAMEELAKTFESVTDKKSAAAAKSKIIALGKKFKTLKTRASALNLDTKDPKIQKDLKKKYKSEVEKVETSGKKMMAAMMKVMMTPELGKELQDAIKHLQ